MPWKETTDPYRIWISEIILQQTRVEQGTDYYLRFIKTFPDLFSLAKANEPDVLKVWEGLGYYSRARNLHSTAKKIVGELNGIFPGTFNEILQLKGVGIYTASAILSFAFNQQYAVVDGNVIRVLARVFGLKNDFASSSGKKIFQAKADSLIQHCNAAAFNQAIMNFGALHCRPKNPDCKNCPFKKKCFAFNENEVDILPTKKKKLKLKHRYFCFELVVVNKRILIEQRDENDIWKGLYQFPLKEISKKDFEQLKQKHSHYHQQLSHQKIFGVFTISKKSMKKNDASFFVAIKNLDAFAFPKMLRQFIDESLHST